MVLPNPRSCKSEVTSYCFRGREDRMQRKRLQRLPEQVPLQDHERLFIIIYEVGYCTLDKDETRPFFQMVDRLSTSGSRSVILTSNRDVSDWSEFFSDMDALECALDRLCDNAICISFSGESYRGRGRSTVSLDFTNPIIRMGN